MKTISKLFTLLLLVAMSISFVSCGGDDNETIINPNEHPNNNGNNNNNNNNDDDDDEEVSIVGTWKYVFDKYDGKECYWMMILEANGNGYFFEEDWSWTEYDIAERYAEKFTYKYKSPYLTIYYSDGYKDIVNVEFLNDDVIETDIDDEGSIWKRQKGAYDNTSIIGYWQCDYWSWSNQYDEYINYFDGVKFNTDGTGYSYEYDGKNVYKDKFIYEYDAPIITLEEEGDTFDVRVKFISKEIFLLDTYDDDELSVYVKSEEPEIDEEDDEISLVGSWTIVMDDPSWKTVIELKSNGQCVAKDYYDIEGDETFTEYSGTFRGTYEVTSKGIEFIFDEDDCSIIMGEYTFDTLTDDYFDAYDSDDWYIYATKN